MKEKKKTKITPSEEGVVKKTPVTSLPIAPGIAVIGFVALVVFIAVLFVMRQSGLIIFPEFIENFISGDNGSDQSSDVSWDQILNEIGGTEVDFEYAQGDDVDWSELTLDEIFSVNAYDNYYQVYTLTYVSDLSSVSSSVSYMRSGEKCRIEYISGKFSNKTVIFDGSRVKITEDGQSKIYEYSDYYPEFSPEGEVGLPTAAHLKAKLADYSKNEYTCSLSVDSESNVFRITFTERTTGNREVYDIKAESGIVLSHSIYAGDSKSPYYELKTSALVTDVNYSGVQFIITE